MHRTVQQLNVSENPNNHSMWPKTWNGVVGREGVVFLVIISEFSNDQTKRGQSTFFPNWQTSPTGKGLDMLYWVETNTTCIPSHKKSLSSGYSAGLTCGWSWIQLLDWEILFLLQATSNFLKISIRKNTLVTVTLGPMLWFEFFLWKSYYSQQLIQLQAIRSRWQNSWIRYWC